MMAFGMGEEERITTLSSGDQTTVDEKEFDYSLFLVEDVERGALASDTLRVI